MVGVRMRRLLTITAAALVLIGGGYGVYAGVRSHRPVSVAPSGPYEVGRATKQWVDRSRIDQFSPIGGTPRVLSAWIWYPAAPGTKGAASAYAPGEWKGLHKFGWAQTQFGEVATGTIDDAPVAPGAFPIVVLMPGLGFAAPQYATIAASLAARGYVVAGVTPTYSANLTVLDGRPVAATAAGDPASLDGPRGDQLVAVWAADARFAAAQTALELAGHVDPAHVLYVGHSFGGAASYEACRTDPACAGAADLDGTPYGPVVRTGLGKPVLLLSSDTAGAATDKSAREFFAACSGTALAYTIAGARHFDFTDYAAYYLAEPLRLIMPLGSIDGRRVRTITNAFLGAFADRATRGAAWTEPTDPEAHPADMQNR
jgi:dienelactone hydrolase